MGTPFDNVTNIINSNRGRVFTFNEAIEFQKLIDKYPSGIYPSINWVNAKDGKPVSIGYTK